MRIELTVNGDDAELDVEPRTTLLDRLARPSRPDGAHAGCEHGVCGACTVLFDGVAVRSCLMFAAQAEGTADHDHRGRDARPGEFSPIQDAFCETHGMQCGYCTPAMILVAHALLADNPSRRARRSSTRSPATSAAAPATRRSSRRSRSPPSACAAPIGRRSCAMTELISATSPPTAASARTAASSPARATSSPISRCPAREHVALVDLPLRRRAHQAVDKRARWPCPACICRRRRGARRQRRRCSPASIRRTCRAARGARSHALCRRMGRRRGGR